jgi:RNA polymerase sigma-70 factor (sigma-E family)
MGVDRVVGIVIDAGDGESAEPVEAVDAPLPVVEVLFRGQYEKLVRLSMALGMTKVEAEEAVQEAFVAFVRRAGSVTPGKELAYLRRSTVNASLGRHRRAKRASLRVLGPDDHDIATPDATDGFGRRAELRDAVGRLPARQRACVVLRYFDDLSEAEIAEALGVSAGSVKTHLSRARASLRRLLEDDDDDR